MYCNGGPSTPIIRRLSASHTPFQGRIICSLGDRNYSFEARNQIGICHGNSTTCNPAASQAQRLYR
jgi:hypothetical protein